MTRHKKTSTAISLSIDLNWHTSAQELDINAGCSFINIQRQSTADIPDIVHVSSETLQGRQRDAFNIIAAHAARDDNPAPVLALFCGSAGSGKSYLIHALRTHLGARCRVVAPTGVAAFGIGGSTTHHTFHLPVQKAAQFTDLLRQSPSGGTRGCRLLYPRRDVNDRNASPWHDRQTFTAGFPGG